MMEKEIRNFDPFNENKDSKSKLNLGQKVALMTIGILFLLFTLFNALDRLGSRDMGSSLLYFGASACALYLIIKFWCKFI